MLNQFGILELIIGKSRSRKTNLLINRLLDPNGLSFENVYIFSKSLYQPKYKYLKEVLKNVPGIEYYEFANNAIEENAQIYSVFMFVDVACEKQKGN